jgi:hypothetical protein
VDWSSEPMVLSVEGDHQQPHPISGHGDIARRSQVAAPAAWNVSHTGQTLIPDENSNKPVFDCGHNTFGRRAGQASQVLRGQYLPDSKPSSPGSPAELMNSGHGSSSNTRVARQSIGMRVEWVNGASD